MSLHWLFKQLEVLSPQELTPTPDRSWDRTSCSLGFSHKWVNFPRPSAHCYRAHFLTISTVAIVCYTLLAVEFLYRVYFNSPFQRKVKVSPPGTPSSDKSWKLENNEVFLPPRLNLMVLGLALATLFVFIRFVTFIGRHPSFSH